MSRGINKVILIGNLGRDPEVRYSQEGKAIASVSLATSTGWKDKESGAAQERTEWHRIVFFNRLAEIAGEFLKQGSKVYIEGSLRTRDWEDKTGQKHRTTEIIANEMQMLDTKGSQASSTQEPATLNTPPPSTPTGEVHASPSADPTLGSPKSETFEDDVPF